MTTPPRLLALLATALILIGCESKVTSANFDAITTGMTQSQVEKKLGGKGEEQDIGGVSIGADGLTSGVKASKDKTFLWKDGGSTISVTFRDGKVIDKGKTGL